MLRTILQHLFFILLRFVHGTVGRLWRAAVRPRNSLITSYGRALRMLLFAHRLESFGRRCVVGRRIRIRDNATISLGDECMILDDVVVIGNGSISLGDRSSIGDGCILVSRARIDIGSDVMIAASCFVTDVDHGVDATTPIREQELDVRPVRIGNDVWIGCHTVVLRGVSIGDGSVIAANSVVTADIPSRVIAAGVPARILRARGQVPMASVAPT